MPDLDNLISISESLMNLFWPTDPSSPFPSDEHIQNLVEEHGIREDISAFSYTFSVLLWLASDDIVAERQEAVRRITSRILELVMENMIFGAISTRTTFKQLYWASHAFGGRFGGVVDEGLAPKLREFWRYIYQFHNYSR